MKFLTIINSLFTKKNIARGKSEQCMVIHTNNVFNTLTSLAKVCFRCGWKTIE